MVEGDRVQLSGNVSLHAALQDIKGGGIIFDCIFVCLHVFIALILAIALKKWEWFFSALIVLIIGFSACVTLLTTGFN